jgi:DNA-directed RNA polymerase specialized sigma24 family protein
MDRGRDSSRSFPTTRHSVLSLARNGDTDARRRAHDAVAGAYWKPVYKYIRLRWRAEPHDAEDLTQGFFTDVVDSTLLDRYDPARGRFRTYLRACVDGFVSNAHKAAGRQKRGGDVTHVPLDFTTAEGEVRELPLASRDDPEALFRDEWVRRLFELAIADTRAQCEADGKTVHFQLFEHYDLAVRDPGERASYEDLARQFNLPVTQVTNFLALVRRRFRAAVLERVRELTASDEEFRAEVCDLLGEGFEP